MIVTELAVFRITEGKLILEEIAPGVDVAAVKAGTEAEFIVHSEITTMKGL